MSVMILLIGCSLSVALAFLIAFVWNTRQGQFDDMHTPSVRILFDDDTKESEQ
ncbi:MAG TPA: cbb3-type cytochrome oxidase assembly protein CcoS [Chitinophagaceae bacterium]|nr:cbb3-type cytochrome oxidase assembly protein CcoS [Chitinophagaceae bacterium]